MFFSTRLGRWSWIGQTFAGQCGTLLLSDYFFIKPRHRLRIKLPAHKLGWNIKMLFEDFCMLEACCGSRASSRVMIKNMRRLDRRGRSLLIDFIPLGRLLAMHIAP